jgi:hypothetical protein
MSCDNAGPLFKRQMMLFRVYALVKPRIGGKPPGVNNNLCVYYLNPLNLVVREGVGVLPGGREHYLGTPFF